MANHYEELGVAFGATFDEVRRAYHTLALQNHPDKTLLLSPEERSVRETKFKRVSGAYEVLFDEEKRAAYDATMPRRPVRSTEERKKKKQQQRKERAERQDYDSQAGSVHPEDVRITTQASFMGDTMDRTFGPWKYMIRLANQFKLRERTEAAEASTDLMTKLSITLKIDAVERRDAFLTEDVYIEIANAPGAVEHLETNLKERCNGSCILTIILHATQNSPFSAQPLELPIDLRLYRNWVRFGPQRDIAARATYLRFYNEHLIAPEDEDLEEFHDDEMQGREIVNVQEECRKWVRSGSTDWKRVAWMEFTRKPQ